MKLLLLGLLLAVAMATRAMAVDAEAAPTEMTQEQAEEVIFGLKQELVKEVKGAVRTINDVFGNPSCEDTPEAERELNQEEEKRSWYDGFTRPVYLKRADTSTPEQEAKRSWHNPTFIKRDDKEEKRMIYVGWKRRSLIPIPSYTRYLFEKSKEETKRSWHNPTFINRDDKEEKRMIYGGWKRRSLISFPSYPPYLFGKRQELQRRGWFGDALRGAAQGACDSIGGKRDEGSNPALREALETLKSKRNDFWNNVLVGAAQGFCNGAYNGRDVSEQGDVNAETPADDTQFVADVNKLEDAVQILAEVLLAAKASIQN